MEIHTHTHSRFMRSGISMHIPPFKSRTRNKTWNPNCESCHSPFLARNANGNPSSETSPPLATSSLAVGRFVAKKGSLARSLKLVASLLIALHPTLQEPVVGNGKGSVRAELYCEGWLRRSCSHISWQRARKVSQCVPLFTLVTQLSKSVE